jgi:catechol 2,3-dioxygenase-like lactoylglutathione lyase family enzyme
MLKDIDHVQLAMPAGEEARARDFYARVLGLREIAKPPHLARRGGLWFTLGARQLHLGVERDFTAARKAHPAFLVEDMGELCRALEANGYPVVNDAPLEGYERCYSADPFGNRVEFLRPR